MEESVDEIFKKKMKQYTQVEIDNGIILHGLCAAGGDEYVGQTIPSWHNLSPYLREHWVISAKRFKEYLGNQSEE